MGQGPFVQAKRIERELLADGSLLPGLIAVLSQSSAPGLLLVYVGPKPDLLRPGMRAISADQLRAEVLTDYDGPTIGLAAVDHIRPDIGTKGPNFVRLDRILRRGNVDVARRTWAALGDYLGAHADEVTDEDARRKLAAEIAGINAAALIAGLPVQARRGLVAVLPQTAEAICVDELSGDGLPLGNLSRLRARQGQNVITFEEVRALAEAAGDLPPDCFPVELRTILRRGGLGEVLDESRRRLARAFHTRWVTDGDPAEEERAFALALEGRFFHRDLDDLVAVVPSADFEQFLTEGAGTYVYRRPLEGAGDTGSPAITSKYLNDAIEDLARPAGPVVFSLLPLRGLCGAGARWSDLGPPMRRSGRTEILARNAWLLVEDLVDERERGQYRRGITSGNLQETMVRCCVILSLTDPWRTRQFRRDEWVLAAYRTLIRVLQIRQDEHSSEAQAGYYEALAQWYSCALTTDDQAVEAALNAVVERLAHAGAQSEVAGDAERLRQVAVPLRLILSGGARVEAYDMLKAPPVRHIPQVVRLATGMTEPIDLLSVPFGISFREYATVQERIRRLSTMPMGGRDKTEGLAKLTARLDQGRRLIFAPKHEARILDALFARALRDTSQLISQLRGGAAVELNLQTESVGLDEITPLLFAVRNVGSLPARDVELELMDAEEFDLLDLTFKQSLQRLAPDEEHTFSFRIRCATDAPEFRIRCVVSWSHGDSAGEVAERQHVNQDFVVSTVGVQVQPFRKKQNPYVFGVHVQDYRQFFGRRSELDELLGHLAHGGPQNVLIRAPRRAGKTSLLHMVRSVLADEDRTAGVRDWFGVPAEWDTNLNATVPVFLNLQGIEELQKDATPPAFYRAVLEGLRDAGLHGPASDRLLRQRGMAYTQFTKALREMVTGAGGRRPVILLDEFDVLDAMADKVAFYSALRTVVTEVQGVTWFVVSALGLYKEIRDYASPLFNIFKILTMGRMDDEAARSLVTSPWEPGGILATASLSFMNDAVYAILYQAGNYPYFIQMLCSELVNFVNETRSNQVRLSTVQQVADGRMVTGEGAAGLAFDFMWQGADATGKLLLLTLLHSDLAMAHDELKAAARRLLESRGRTDLVDALLGQFDDSLTRLGYIGAVRHLPMSGYAFGVPMFRSLLVRTAERMDLDAVTIEELAAPAAGAAK